MFGPTWTECFSLNTLLVMNNGRGWRSKKRWSALNHKSTIGALWSSICGNHHWEKWRRWYGWEIMVGCMQKFLLGIKDYIVILHMNCSKKALLFYSGKSQTVDGFYPQRLWTLCCINMFTRDLLQSLIIECLHFKFCTSFQTKSSQPTTVTND